MAEGINLAGAIGMTGKRESVISDLPAYIKDTGDYLAARNEQRRKEEAQKKAQEQEWENNQQENFSKNVSANLGSRVQHWNNEFEKYAQAETAKAYTAHLNPKLTLAQKQKAREEAHYNIAKAKSIYLNAEEDVDKKINPVVNDDKFASQEASDYIYGKRPTVSSEITENVKPTQGNPLAQIPQSDISTDQSKAPLSSSNPLAPIENKNNIEKEVKVTTTHNKPLYEMNHEEIAKDYENGVAAKVLPMVKLHETSLDKIASEAIPSNKKTDFIKITKENINGVDKVTKTINHEGMVNAVESIYTNIITQSGKEATRMYNKLHQDAYIASKDNKNITNEQEREAFMDDYIKEHALGAAKTWVDTEYKNQEMANENIDKTANKGGITNNFFYGTTKKPTDRPEAKDEFKIVDTENKKKVEDSKATIVDLTGKKAEAVAQLKLEQSKSDGGIPTKINMLKKEISDYDEALNSTNAELNSAKNNTELQLDSFISTPATGETKISFKDGNKVVKDANFVKAGWKGNKAYMVYNIETGDKDNKVSHQKYVEITPSVLNDLDDVKFPDGFSLRKAIEKTRPKQATPTKKEAPKKEEAKKVDLRKKYNY